MECLLLYRNSENRTHDLLLPKQALYQAELYSVLLGVILAKKVFFLNRFFEKRVVFDIRFNF